MKAINQFELGSKRYTATPADPAGTGIGCGGCAFENSPSLCLAAPKCAPSERSDGQDVIFVEADASPAVPVVGVLRDTDWPLLQQQKLQLIERLDDKEGDFLAGLVSFLDALQDAVVDEGIATEEEVFGKSEEEN